MYQRQCIGATVDRAGQNSWPQPADRMRAVIPIVVTESENRRLSDIGSALRDLQAPLLPVAAARRLPEKRGMDLATAPNCRKTRAFARRPQHAEVSFTDFLHSAHLPMTLAVLAPDKISRVIEWCLAVDAGGAIRPPR
jgi:hypothetical protein